MQYKFRLAIPGEFQDYKQKIEAALRAEWPSSEFTYAEIDHGQCLVTGLELPKSASVIDAQSGEDVLGEATIAAAQEIVGEICWEHARK
jgi:hypothetical protein